MKVLKMIGYRKKICVLLFFPLFVLEGCVIKDVGRSIKYTMQGDYYLTSRQYSKGRDVFASALQHNPDDPAAHYFLGRLFLAEKKVNEALPYLQQAVKMEKGKADYYFWLGLAQGEAGDTVLEEDSYEEALAIDEDHLQALTYLAHRQLDKKEYVTALVNYEKVLKKWPESPSALYNRALVLKKLGRSPEELLAWLAYLDQYPSGAMARNATNHLNALGDFSFQNFTIGIRTVTLKKIAFQPFSSRLVSSSLPSLKLVGEILDNMNPGTLQIVWFQKKNIELAKKRSQSIKKYIEESTSGLNPERIQISWFDVQDEIIVDDKKVIKDESVQFFLTKE